MVFCSRIYMCANINLIQKSSEAKSSDSDIYRNIALISLPVKILNHIIIKQSGALKTSTYQCNYKSNSSTRLCNTKVTGNGANPVSTDQYLMSRKHLIELLLMSYSMNYVIVLCVPGLQSYCTTCIQIKSVV